MSFLALKVNCGKSVDFVLIAVSYCLVDVLPVDGVTGQYRGTQVAKRGLHKDVLLPHVGLIVRVADEIKKDQRDV